MNEALVERFGRSRQGVKDAREQAHVWILPQQLNTRIREYHDAAKKPVDGGSWLNRPEIPTSAEILDTDNTSSSSSDIVEIVPNRPVGAWESKEAYLGAQYELLREDALQPLRLAVSQVRMTPDAAEDAFNGTIGIYEKVHICGVICSTRGIAHRITFSLGRVGKKIRWDQSKRLITGGLVVLTPANDMFQTKAVVATVAARALEPLENNPPEIDIAIARPEEMEIDPAIEWVMVEDRSGFYEADRHTLLALQKMMREPFPLQEHIVGAASRVPAPAYVKIFPKYDLTSVLRNNKHATYENFDILKSWPRQPESDMDASQLAAFRRILAKRLAIVQGPPGTGKTYVSEQAIKTMLVNRRSNDEPPIIIACQTNHAVDQLLRKIAVFCRDYIRLGGRSKDNEIKKRTLYEIKQEESRDPVAGSFLGNARKKMKELENQFGALLLPMNTTPDPSKPPNPRVLDFRLMEKEGLLTKKQADSLKAGASQWVQAKQSGTQEACASPFTVWLGKALVTVPNKQKPEEFGFDYEEQDLAFEHLKELEAENIAKDDDDFETLYGLHLQLCDMFTCRKVTGITEAKAKEVLRKEQDVWKIPEAMRGPIYRHLQAEMKKHLRDGFRDLAKVFNEQAAKRKIGQWEHDETHLKQQKIIGMTTTGLSKYRALIAALQPKVILIEEAAETLEAPVTVACLPSLEHLILVGDHKQLRPHCHVKSHEDKPYYFNVSLFERLVNNDLEFDTLTKQRRMIPEIRRVMYPIYSDKITDHPSVLDPAKRPNVPGMGGVNSMFVTHQWAEQRDDQMSVYNLEEAEMIMGFVEYLINNGMKAQEITILTFYNGQRKRIFSMVRDKQKSENSIFRDGTIPTVVTVDSYQGEENKVVILSLTRSNDKGQIGFLSIDNRVCVALSRAQRGLYIFGNGMLLYEHKTCKTWQKVIDIMAGKKRKAERPKIEPISRIGEHLPVRCSNHNNLSYIGKPEEWAEKVSAGGCSEPCGGKMPCGHECTLKCHPFEHDTFLCPAFCGKPLPCGHGICEMACGEICACGVCLRARAITMRQGHPQEVVMEGYVPFDGQERLMGQPTPMHQRGSGGKQSQHSSSASEWQDFATAEPKRYADEVARLSQVSSSRTSPEKKERRSSPLKRDEEPLLDLGVMAGEAAAKMMGMKSFGTSPEKDADDQVIELGLSSQALADKMRMMKPFGMDGAVDEMGSAGAVVKNGEKDGWGADRSLLD